MITDIPVVWYGQGGEAPNIREFWWNADRQDVHSSVFSLVLRIRQLQYFRKSDYIRYARLYSNTEFERFVSGVTAGLFGKKITFNVTKACVDTACAKISPNKTRPIFLTHKGSKKQQNRAKKLTQYIDGCFYEGGVYQKGMQVFKDGGIFGTGILKVVEINGKLSYERVFIDEIIVDDLDGRLQAPRQMHQVRTINREVLKGMFSDVPGINRTVIYAINDADAEPRPNKSAVSDLIEVIESWHLPSSPDSDDGRHTICIKNFTLLDEDWKHDFFPFCVFRWDEPILGWYGEGLASQLIGIQLEINTLLLRIKEAQELMAIPRIFVEEASSVNTSHLNDEVGGIIKYRGQKPEAMTWTAMNPEIYNYLEYLFKKAFEITGVSQLSASSKKPSGLDSGVALREYQDIETERFSLVAERYQQFFLDVAKMTIAIQREIAEQDPKLSIKVKGKKFIDTIKWKEVDMDEDKYVMDIFPTAFLPRTPEGKLQFIQELIQSGFIDPEWGLSLLDFPDLEQFFNIKTAAIDDIQMVLEKIVEDEDYSPPEIYMNLQLAIEMGQATYLRAKTDGTSENALEMLQRFIDDSQNLLQAMNPPQPMQPPGGQAPQTVARADKRPRSDLIPEVTQPTS